MCGINGLVSRSPEAWSTGFEAVRDRLHHRGPDDAGAWRSSCGRVWLGHRRLSILDLSPAGHQPMLSVSERYAMVFNGEIYNYVELRAELETLGHCFNSSGDSEVILAAYAEWGQDCLNRFNGMFAIAIYDRGEGNIPASIFFARDRAGKKPLYIARGSDGISFASELKAIPERFRGGLNTEALNFYFALGYVPAGHCILDGVSKLPPAHAARYVIDSGEFDQWRWWSLPLLEASEPVKVEDLLDEAESLLHDAVRLRLRSDVPVGVLLSGGLDSSLVVASACRAAAHIKTFTIGFPGSRLDETSYAEIVARHFGTEHHVLPLPAPSLSVLDELAPFIDEPIADSSIMPTYLVSKLTAQHVKVALGGDGGDELFGGYNDYTTACIDHERLKFVPGFVFEAASKLAGYLPTGLRGRNRVYALRGGPYQSLVWGSPYFDEPARKRILPPDMIGGLGKAFLSPELFRLALFNTGGDPVDAMTRTHFGSILPDDFLVKVDRASMAVALEMRCPLLDVRLIEFAFGRLPSEWKVVGAEGRRLQKLLGVRLLPSELNVNRKQGFSIPLDDWLRSTGEQGLMRSLEVLHDFVNMEEVRRLVRGHLNGRANGSRLFALMMLAISLRNILK